MLSYLRRLIEPDDDGAAEEPVIEADNSYLFGSHDDSENVLGYTELVDRGGGNDDDISLLIHAETQDGDDSDDDDRAEDESSDDGGDWAFAEDSGAEDQWFSDEEDEQNGAFAPLYEYQFQKIDDRLYAVRPLGRTDCTVIIARDDHPLINYVERLAEDERIEMRALLAREPVTFEQLQREYEGRLPGCLRAFTSNVLLRPVRYRLFYAKDDQCDDDADIENYERDGAVHISRAYRRPSRASVLLDETPSGVDPGDGYPSAQDSPLFVLGDLDPDAEKRAATLVDIANGHADESDLERFEMRHNDGNLMPFSSSKPTAAPPRNGEANAFTDPSPVHAGDPHRWIVVKMHYYVMYKAFTESCSRSGSLERMITEAQQRAGALGYAFGSPPPSGEEHYTPRQERAVVERMLEMSIGERAAENNVEARRVAVEQCARELGDRVADLMQLGVELRDSKNEEIRERAGALLDLAKRARDSAQALTDAQRARLDDRFVGEGADKSA